LKKSILLYFKSQIYIKVFIFLVSVICTLSEKSNTDPSEQYKLEQEEELETKRRRRRKKKKEEDGGNGKQPAATARTAADEATGATSGSRKGTHMGSVRATPAAPVLHPLQP
jgi:hypothetical protein